MNTARAKESAEKSFAPVPLQARTTLNLGSADGGIYFEIYYREIRSGDKVKLRAMLGPEEKTTGEFTATDDNPLKITVGKEFFNVFIGHEVLVSAEYKHASDASEWHQTGAIAIKVEDI